MMLKHKRRRVQVKQNGVWIDTGPIHGTRVDAATYADKHDLGKPDENWRIVDVDS